MTKVAEPSLPAPPDVPPERSVADLSPTNFPSYFKERYQRLALVSHTKHLAALDRNDDETLVVSSDWFLWQKAVHDQWHCIFYETGLLNFTEDNDPLQDYVSKTEAITLTKEENKRIYRELD